MFDFEDRAMFEPEPANDDAPAAQALHEAFATTDRRIDAQLAWVSAIGLLGTLLFALFVVLKI